MSVRALANRLVAIGMTDPADAKGHPALQARPQGVRDPYERRWRELRRARTHASYAISACALVGVVGACMLPSHITKLIVAMLAVVLAAPFVLRFGSFPCPRCKEPFVRRTDREHDFFAKRCLHCGLAVGTSKADAQPASSEPKIRILL